MLGGQTPGAPHGAPRRAFAEAMRRQSLAFPYADVEQGVVTREGGRLRLRHREPAA
jgi:hypothetical protein